MGKLEITGNAEHITYCDRMEISITFSLTSANFRNVSSIVMKQCEEFLRRLEKIQIDTSSIILNQDTVHEHNNYRDDSEDEISASRALTIKAGYDPKLINVIHSIVDDMQSELAGMHGFFISFGLSQELSNEGELMDTLRREALLDAKKQAEMLAESIGQKVISLISADKKERSKAVPDECVSYILCMDAVEPEEFKLSNHLSAEEKKLSEYIYTVWEIG